MPRKKHHRQKKRAQQSKRARAMPQRMQTPDARGWFPSTRRRAA